MNINLATRIYIDHAKVKLAFISVFIVLISLIAWNIWGIISQYDEVRTITGSMTSGQLSSSGRTVSDNEYKQVMERVTLVNSFLGTRSSSILKLLDRLETVAPDSLMLTEISPDGKNGGYRISGHASDFRKVRVLYENMSAGDLFSDVFLVSQARLKVSDSQQGVSFTLTAKVRQ